MSGNDPTVEPGGASGQPSAPQAKGRKAFSSARRSLTEKEVSSPAIALILIEDIERLEEEKADLVDYRDRFHSLDKEHAVLRAKSEINLGMEIVFGVAISLGFGAIGYAPSIWSTGAAGPVIAIIGGIMVVVGIAAKVVAAKSVMKAQAK